MSLIGKKPVKIEDGVSVSITPESVTVKGPKGELVVKVMPEIKVEEKDGLLFVSVRDEKHPNAKAFHGLVRSLLANAVEGVTKGFQKGLELVGMGFRVAKEGKNLKFALGFSHPVLFESPLGIEFEVPEQTKVLVKGIDKYSVGQTAARIRSLKKPEPYKGKGIKYDDEVVLRKAGKAGKVGTGSAAS